MFGHLRPVLVENLAAVGVDLHLADNGHARTFEAELQPANAGEQAQHVHVPPPSCPVSARRARSRARFSPLTNALSWGQLTTAAASCSKTSASRVASAASFRCRACASSAS